MMRILIVDDDPVSRSVLSRTLEQWGYETLVACDGAEGLDLIQQEKISFVISDWMMPKIDGLELCRRIRTAASDHYIYIILLTAKSDKEELVRGMDAGADDFIVKPFNKGELQVRINAGKRILELERSLEERNKKLESAYAIIRKDLQAAAKMQMDLLPDTNSVIENIRFDWLFVPCTYVAGDIFNFFRLDHNHIGFYILDVAGHGIPSAMLSFSLSKMFTPFAFQLQQTNGRSTELAYDTKMLHPGKALFELNNKFQGDADNSPYFTMIYGVVDLVQQKIRMSQAGHPAPVLIRADGRAELLGDGGYPIGMFPDLEYSEQEFDFLAGDRLFVYSDGIPECANARRQQFSQERLMRYLHEWRGKNLRDQLQALKAKLCEWRGTDSFDDDVSMMAIECLASESSPSS